MCEANIFQERAENLTKREIEEWGVFTEKDNEIVRKLMSNSAKLIVGPRGSGKSMLMRYAYYKAINTEIIFPVYSNFEKYLYIEPILHRKSNGNVIFGKWVLAKIVVDTIFTIEDLEIELSSDINLLVKKYFNTTIDRLKDIVHQLEGGNDTLNDEIDEYTISVGSVIEYIEEITKLTKRSRAILLLDDAAHAFSSDLQREFFEIYRILKSNCVSSKAAVYPGITHFSPYFNIGHDGLFIEVGYPPDKEGYIEFCDGILKRRLSEDLYKKLTDKRERIENIYFAANGIPRGIIVMVQYLLEDTNKYPPKEAKFYEVIDNWTSTIESFFMSLKYRLPRYRNFIDVGIELIDKILNEVKNYNKNKDEKEKAVYFGLTHPMPKELEKVINILEYSGLIVKCSKISKGENGIYNRYMIHLGKIISTNALAQGKRKTLGFSCKALNNINRRAYLRFKSKNILDEKLMSNCKLSLPQCPNCGRDRISEEARFCAYCGKELPSLSVFEEIINQDISSLPLTKKKIESIKRDSSIRYIKDILMDENGTELKKVKGIQGYWADKIRSYAEEFIGG